MYIYIMVLFLISCANVTPYDRGYLADPIMDINNSEEATYDQHMHKALTQGSIGIPISGGGCGCEQ